jgi:uncharacterized protein (DUF1501 family)
MNKLNRRDLLKAMGAGSFLSAYGGHLHAAPATDYRALVCIFLDGGNDGFNMVVPRSIAEHNVYANSRQDLAIARDDLLPISPINSDGALYGLHPSMPALQNLFEGGQAAFINNIGPLIEPTTKDQYLNATVDLPPKLFSHNNQKDQWHSLKGLDATSTGWAGRIADVLEQDYINQQAPLNISSFGNRLFQVGQQTTPYIMGRAGAELFNGINDHLEDPALRNTFTRILNADYGSVYERSFATAQKKALNGSSRLFDAMNTTPPFTTTQFPSSDLGKQLNTVAKLIGARDELQMNRQIFLVGINGFDTHDSQNKQQPGLLGDLSESVNAFYKATVELGVANSVTTFTQSDFGRTLTSNGDGSDHGWGSNHMVIGGGVRGGYFYGTYPSLEMNGPDEVRGGRIIPTTSATQYGATLAKWIGVPPQNITDIAPNIGNFSTPDLGFMI